MAFNSTIQIINAERMQSIGFSHSWGLSVELAIPGPGEFAKALSAFPLKWMMLGASYTYTQSTTYDTGQMYWRQTNTTDYCGYFTFVPYMITFVFPVTSFSCSPHQARTNLFPLSYIGPVAP